MRIRSPLLAVTVLGLLGAVAQAGPQVRLNTSLGAITVELADDKAPKTVENFLAYARDGFYNGTIFHRVIDGFMIQGGGFSADFKQKPTRAPVANEADNGLTNVRGSIATVSYTHLDVYKRQALYPVINQNRQPHSMQDWGFYF